MAEETATWVAHLSAADEQSLARTRTRIPHGFLCWRVHHFETFGHDNPVPYAQPERNLKPVLRSGVGVSKKNEKIKKCQLRFFYVCLFVSGFENSLSLHCYRQWNQVQTAFGSIRSETVALRFIVYKHQPKGRLFILNIGPSAGAVMWIVMSVY